MLFIFFHKPQPSFVLPLSYYYTVSFRKKNHHFIRKTQNKISILLSNPDEHNHYHACDKLNEKVATSFV